MGNRKSKTPAGDRVSTRGPLKSHLRNVSSSPSSSPPQNVVQPTQQTFQGGNSAKSTPASDWASAVGLDRSDIHRASVSSFSSPQRNFKASQETPHKKHARNSPASIMTSLHGVPVYSHGPPTRPVTSTTRSAIDLQRILSKDDPPAAIGKIQLPKLDQTLLHKSSAYWRSTLIKPTTHADQQQQEQRLQSPAATTTLQPLLPFEPRKCHWRALRDVAFVRDGCIKLSEENLCALLRFRYAKHDPLMARVETHHVGAMYEFCQGLQEEMYEKTAGGLIRLHMRKDLKLMREGGVGAVSGDF